MKHAFGVGQNIAGLASVLVRAPSIDYQVSDAVLAGEALAKLAVADGGPTTINEALAWKNESRERVDRYEAILADLRAKNAAMPERAGVV